MAQITISTDDLISQAIELERDKQEVLEDIATHRENMRRTASMVKDAEFSEFVDNFYPEKKRGVTRTPEEVQAATEWKRNLLKSYGVEPTDEDESNGNGNAEPAKEEAAKETASNKK